MRRRSRSGKGSSQAGAPEEADSPERADRSDEGGGSPEPTPAPPRSRVRPIHKADADPVARGVEDRPRFTVELVGDQVGQAVSQIVEEAQYWINRGRYNKVRISRAGKPLLPDLPVGALLAIEAATFFWAGLLRGAIVNIASNVLFEVELINDAKEHLALGREHFLRGDLDEADREMRQALAIDDRDPEIQLAFGSLLKAMGERGKSLRYFRRARDLDPTGPHGEEARQQLERLGVVE